MSSNYYESNPWSLDEVFEVFRDGEAIGHKPLHKMENKTTIESILPTEVLALVRQAPANPMTRGHVRSVTNLVYPDEVTTTEGIEEYVLENYDESKAPKRNCIQSNFTRSMLERQAIRDEEERQAVVCMDVGATETEYGRASYWCTNNYNERMRVRAVDIEGCTTKSEAIEVLTRLRESALEDADEDSDDYEYEPSETGGTENYQYTDTDNHLWLACREQIAEHLGLSVEEMENE